MTHRLQPQNLEYSRLQTLDKEVLHAFCDHMEELEDLMDHFDELPAFRCTLDAKTLLQNLISSDTMKYIQEADGETA